MMTYFLIMCLKLIESKCSQWTFLLVRNEGSEHLQSQETEEGTLKGSHSLHARAGNCLLANIGMCIRQFFLSGSQSLSLS